MGEDTARTFVGMDVHARSISLAIIGPTGELREDKIPATSEAVRRVFERFPDPAGVRACYEAGRRDTACSASSRSWASTASSSRPRSSRGDRVDASRPTAAMPARSWVCSAPAS